MIDGNRFEVRESRILICICVTQIKPCKESETKQYKWSAGSLEIPATVTK